MFPSLQILETALKSAALAPGLLSMPSLQTPSFVSLFCSAGPWNATGPTTVTQVNNQYPCFKGKGLTVSIIAATLM